MSLPGEHGRKTFAEWWNQEKPLYGDEAKIIAEYAAATKMTKKKLEEFLSKHKSDIRVDFDTFKKRVMDKFKRIDKTSAAFSQAIPWLVDQDTGEKIPGQPGRSLMRHLKEHHGLSTQEIWAMDAEAGKDHDPQLQGVASLDQ